MKVREESHPANFRSAVENPSEWEETVHGVPCTRSAGICQNLICDVRFNQCDIGNHWHIVLITQKTEQVDKDQRLTINRFLPFFDLNSYLNNYNHTYISYNNIQFRTIQSMLYSSDESEYYYCTCFDN
jgi:hypothetical protein